MCLIACLSPAQIRQAGARQLGPQLLLAAWTSDTDSALRLIAAGADVNYLGPAYEPKAKFPVRRKSSALHLACESRNTALVRLLLQHHARLNQRDEDGNTPLHNAVDMGFVEGVRLLLSHGANYRLKNNYGSTVLRLSGRDEQPASVEESQAIRRLILDQMAKDRRRTRHK